MIALVIELTGIRKKYLLNKRTGHLLCYTPHPTKKKFIFLRKPNMMFSSLFKSIIYLLKEKKLKNEFGNVFKILMFISM